MPSKSLAQHRLMQAALFNPEIAKKRGIPQGVARDFVEADKGRRFVEKQADHSLLDSCARLILRTSAL